VDGHFHTVLSLASIFGGYILIGSLPILGGIIFSIRIIINDVNGNIRK
jgi:hypothetical protein